ncbi:MAG: ABC transporter substrate-binding protein, partial [Ilumatobacteraceae bacterium]
MGSPRLVTVLLVASLAVLGLSCSSDTSRDTASGNADATNATSPTVVVTYSILAAVVRELLAGVADVVTVIPDGQDPHDFEP